MKLKKLTISILTLLLTLALLAGCGAQPSASQSAAPSASQPAELKTTDFLGREITLTAVPEKIVSLTPSNTELLYALGLGGKVVGVDASSNYPEEAAGKTVVGDYSGVNIELVVSLAPDVVFSSTALQADTIAALENAGIKVVASEAGTYAQLKESVSMIGTMGGAEQTAVDALLHSIEAKEAQLKALAGEVPVSAYYIVSYGEYGDWSVGPSSFIFDVLTMGGVELITKDMAFAFPQYSLEQLTAADPEWIINGAYGASLEDLRAAQGYGELTAIKEGRFVSADVDKMNRPTERLLDEAISVVSQIKAAQ